MASLTQLLSLLKGASKLPTIVKDTLEAGAQGPRVIPTAMKPKFSLLNTLTGLGKPGQVRADVGAMERFAAGRGALPGIQKYNPLISAEKGRVTLPRVAGGLTGIAMGLGGLSDMGGGTDASGLTPEQIAELNAANQAGSQAQLKSLFMPQTDTSLLSLASMLGGAGSTSTKARGAGGGGYSGTSVLPSVAYGSAAAGMNAANVGDTGSGYSGMTPVSGASATAPGTAKQTGNILDRWIIDMANAQDKTGQTAAAINALSRSSKDKYILAALAQQQQAQQQGEKDYRSYLLKSAIANPNLYASSDFTGTEAGLADVYKQWNSMSPSQKEQMGRTQGIYTPQDLYSAMKAQNPTQYGG